jgi:hypothetical protein
MRALLCEMFLGWSLKICPDGYSPSYVEAVLVAYDRGLKQQPLGKKSPLALQAE